MKHLIFIRGEPSILRDDTVLAVMTVLNPDINSIRGIKLSIDDYGIINDKRDSAAAYSNVKKMLRKILGGSHQETFIVIDNPNTNQSNWNTMTSIAGALNVSISTIGIQVGKYEQGAKNTHKYKKIPNIRLFNADMGKYLYVEDEQQITDVIETLEAIVKTEGT